MSADGDLLGQYYPETPYNFDVPPNPYLIGPIKSILTVVQNRFTQLYADIAELQAMITVQTATGNYLDAHGILYATPRLPGEPDDAYRPRILEAITRGKLTVIAIQAVVTDYLNSTTNVSGGGIVPTSDVYDLSSNPTKCAEDAAAGQAIELWDVVIEIDYAVSEDAVWFQDYAYLDYTTFLTDAGTAYNGESDLPAQLALQIRQTRAAGANIIYKTVTTIGT